MRCKKHYTDLSSTVGVCSCCLRERLLSVIAAQDSENIPANYRSVSPYFHHWKRNQTDGAVVSSDNNLCNDRRRQPPDAPRHRHSVSDQLFYQTPEVGRNNAGAETNKKRSFIRFFSFSFSKIFRSRNRKPVDSVTDPVVTDPVMDPRASDSTFRRHCGGGAVRRRHRDRGMSPVRSSDTGGDEDEDESNIATSEYESTESWKNTPRRTPAHRGGGGGGHRRNMSGLAFCLSPLVRASPNRQWNQKGLPPEVVFSGEIRAPVKAHLSNTKSFHANRSRKLADFGRDNLNR